MKKLTGVFLAILTLTCIAFTFPSRQINLVIDAGHGGHDHGAKSELYIEKDITQTIATYVSRLNSNKNLAVHLTRKADEFVELAHRAIVANELKADLLLSLHVNQSPSSHKSGIDLFVGKSTPTSAASRILAEKLKARFEMEGFKVNAIQEAPFMILKKAEVPAISIELGYMSNKKDAAYLTNTKSQEQIAKILLDFASEL